MKFFGKAQLKFSQILALGFVLVLLLGVACGTAATATPPPGTAPPATPPKAGGLPTATSGPTPTPGLAAPVVHPGKLTWMVGSLGNERFDYTFSAQAGHDYARQIHAFLISSDVKEGRRVLIPGIATQWGVSSNGLTWTLTIRRGVKFHDGTEVTAEDVLWYLRHNMGPQSVDYAIGSSLGQIMDRIEPTGPDQVSVTTKIPISDFPASISEATGSWVGVVIPKRATVHDVKEEADYDRNPIGAGIMRLVKHVPAAQMTFERFADYYYQPKNGFPTDKRVNFAVLDLRLVPEEATRVAALRAGDADIGAVSLSAREQVEAGGGRLLFGQEGAYLYANQRGCWKPQFPCHDQRVRQALNYATDTKSIQKLYGGAVVMQVKGWAFVTPSSIGYSPELDPYPFDPNKARQLLADAGYAGGKGFGKLIINTWVSVATPLMPESAQLAADNWRRELGLDVEVKVGDEAALKKAYTITDDLSGQVLWRDNETRGDGGGSLRTSWGIPTEYRRAHEDPELFALTAKTLAIFDPVERDTVLNNTYRRLRDEAYWISLGYINIPWGVGPRIRTWEPYPLSFYPSALHTITLK